MRRSHSRVAIFAQGADFSVDYALPFPHARVERESSRRPRLYPRALGVRGIDEIVAFTGGEHRRYTQNSASAVPDPFRTQVGGCGGRGDFAPVLRQFAVGEGFDELRRDIDRYRYECNRICPLSKVHEEFQCRER